MPAPQLTLGHASLKLAIESLHREGKSHHEIMAATGKPLNTIYQYLPAALKRDRSNRPSRTGQDCAPKADSAINAGITAHRPTTGGECRVVEVRLRERDYARLISLARKSAHTPSTYMANLLAQDIKALTP